MKFYPAFRKIFTQLYFFNHWPVCLFELLNSQNPIIVCVFESLHSYRISRQGSHTLLNISIVNMLFPRRLKHFRAANFISTTSSIILLYRLKSSYSPSYTRLIFHTAIRISACKPKTSSLSTNCPSLEYPPHKYPVQPHCCLFC